MLPYARQRTRLFSSTTGLKTIVGQPRTVTRVNGQELCSDFVGAPDLDHSLFISRTRKKGGIISGFRNGISTYSWDNVPLEPVGDAITLPFSMSEGEAALKGYNLSNPSRVGLKLVASVAELRDLPHMLRFAGRVKNASTLPREMILRAYQVNKGVRGDFASRRGLSADEVLQLLIAKVHPSQQGGLSAAKAVAAANLAWQFGWKPLIGDIMQMIGFVSAVDRRRKEIDRLYSGRGIKRKITLQNDTVTSVKPNVTVNSEGIVCRMDVTTKCDTRIWTVARWKPQNRSGLPPADWQIVQAMYGLNTHGVLTSAWELLPWSWFADWFANVGDLLEVGNNQLGASATINVMRHQRIRTTAPGGFYEVYSGPNLIAAATITSYEKLVETKTRKPGLPDLTSISGRIPILGDGQLSILLSISLLMGTR